MQQLLQKQSEKLSGEKYKNVLTHAFKQRRKRQRISRLSNADLILSKWNEFTLLRIEFVKLYPALKPDEVFESAYSWVLQELTMMAEYQLVSDNISAILQEEANKK